ncbi:hypothetical protein COB11_03430 [Candidatus Aerophobetes bacterium]|uniref:Uncharacterized protein n=1 Tax=Aerophobetes bacterium TaxID=2030807 RepID=A0A2A4YJC0_UNCAE|nr:MAG: hypothetical protein COB11_03430 [Candidatus Aerophobetes bacterium]
MCKECWDADHRESLIENSDCEGKLTPFMSMSVLRKNLFDKWRKTNQTAHVVHKEAIINPPLNEYKWTELLSNHSNVQLSVRFV